MLFWSWICHSTDIVNKHRWSRASWRCTSWRCTWETDWMRRGWVVWKEVSDWRSCRNCSCAPLRKPESETEGCSICHSRNLYYYRGGLVDERCHSRNLWMKGDVPPLSSVQNEDRCTLCAMLFPEVAVAFQEPVDERWCVAALLNAMQDLWSHCSACSQQFCSWMQTMQSSELVNIYYVSAHQWGFSLQWIVVQHIVWYCNITKQSADRCRQVYSVCNAIPRSCSCSKE